MGMEFVNLTWEQMCDLMCGKPEEDEEVIKVGSIGKSNQATQGKQVTQLEGFYGADATELEIARREAEHNARVEKLNNEFTKSVDRNSVGKVTSTNYSLNLGDNYKLNISKKTIGKSTIITGSASVPSTQPNVRSDTIYRGDFKTVEEAKKKLRAEMRKYLNG